MRREDVSVDEIVAIILSRLGTDPHREQEQKGFLRQEFGDNALAYDLLFCRDRSVSTEVRRWAAELVAERLKADQHEQPLISAGDWSELRSEIENAMGGQPEESSTAFPKLLEALANAVLAPIISGFERIVRSSDNLYAEYWRLVEIVCTLAAVRNLPIIEFLNIEGSHDEITRQLFTKEEYLSRWGQDISSELPEDLSALANELSSVLDDGEGEEFDLPEMVVRMTSFGFPALQKALRKWDLQEADRIYGP